MATSVSVTANNNDNEMVEVRVGQFILTVDKQTADALKNPAVAQSYLESIETHLSSSTEINNAPQETCKEAVWTSAKRPTAKDHEATLAFLHLRRQFEKEFVDKKTTNNDVWAKIAGQMNNSGFFVGEGVQGRDKCRQKFANLQTSYIKYNERRTRTGEGKLKTPPYYEELHIILSDKHKANPKLLIDSAVSASEDDSTTSFKDWESSEDQEPSTSSAVTTPTTSHRFSQIRKKLKPETPRNQSLKELVTIQKENQSARKEEFSQMMTFFEKQSEQRHQQMMALITSLKSKPHKKRARHSSDDSD